MRDRIVVRFREKGSPAESVTLPRPLTWDENHHREAIRWIDRLYAARGDGQQTLKAALEEISTRSNKIGAKRAVTWREIAKALEHSRVWESQKCSTKTFTKNWRPFIDLAVKLIEKGKVHDGYTLLKEALKQWGEAPTMKVEAGRYIGIFMEFAVARHGAPRTWLITPFDKQELIPKAPKARLKAVLDDAELLDLVELADSVNPRWGNVFRLLTQYGLRPIELQHLNSRVHPVTKKPAIWCSYCKKGGLEQTDPRFLQAMYLRDGDDKPVQWDLAQSMAEGTLLLPTGNDGNIRKLSGSAINTYLHRKGMATKKPTGPVQKYWAELVEKYAAKTPVEWVRGYSFRDSFSIRCHREGVPKPSICEAMGHSEGVHDRSYRTMTQGIVTRDFAQTAETIPVGIPLGVVDQ